MKNFSFFFLLFLSVFQMQPKYLTHGQIPDEVVRLKLVSIENETDNQSFQVFNNYDGPSALVQPHHMFTFEPANEIGLSVGHLVVVKCCQGSYLPVFMQDGGYHASGKVDDEYQQPYFVSMWLGTPNQPESRKVRVCYAVKKGTVGKIGLRIGQKGDYRLVAYENVTFIE